MAKLILIYASMTGNTEAVMDKIAELLSSKDIEFNKSRSEETESSVIDSNNIFIFATSTWVQGSMNRFLETLFEYIKSNNMSGKKAAFIGLGNKAYDEQYFNQAIKDLKQAFIDSGGTQIGETLIIDGDPYALLNTDVTTWLNNITKQLIT